MEEREDEEGHNPLKLPMGWDGKPIPYWLYKLHGLDLEFTCEICGNYSYWGRRAYERHFRNQASARDAVPEHTQHEGFRRGASVFLLRLAIFGFFASRARRLLATRRSSIFATGLMDTLHWALIPVKHTHLGLENPQPDPPATDRRVCPPPRSTALNFFFGFSSPGSTRD